jgi:hypothetical protein
VAPAGVHRPFCYRMLSGLFLAFWRAEGKGYQKLSTKTARIK